MIKTLLEKTAEELGLNLGMPLEERAYAEDLDVQAELDDIRDENSLEYDSEYQLMHGNVNSRDSIALSLGLGTPEQFNRGRQPFFLRRSRPKDNFGLEYEIQQEISDDKYQVYMYGEGGLSARKEADKIISNRNFYMENFGFHYHSHFEKPGSLGAELNKLYNGFYHGNFYTAPLFYFSVDKDNKINIDDNCVSESDSCIEAIIKNMKDELEGKTFDDIRANDLKKFVREIYSLLGR